MFRRRRYYHTLRFKLTTLYTAVLGVLLAAMSLGILFVRENDLREQLDERLRDRADVVMDEISLSIDQADESKTTLNYPELLLPFRLPEYYCQIRMEDGTVVEQSQSLRDATLPLRQDGLRTMYPIGHAVFETIDSRKNGLSPKLPGTLRLLTMYRDDLNTQPFYLQIGTGTAAMVYSIAQLKRALVVSVPVLIVLIALASWLIIGKALYPIMRVAEVADNIHTDLFTRRFDVPGSKDEVADMIARINLMLDRLSEHYRSLEKYIADAAHELKTPLTVLLSEAQVLMQQNRTQEEYTRFVLNVQDEVRVLAQTVDSLLTLARAEAGIPLDAVSNVLVNDIVMDAVERCNPLATQMEIRLIPNLVLSESSSQEPTVRGDVSLLRLMISNLIRNAIRYSPSDTVVEINVRFDDISSVITVRDHGPGIPAQYQDKVFDRFFRISNVQSSLKGIGLGLTIVRGVAQLHGGKVTVKNHAEGGCEFAVHLPQVTDETP